MRLLKREPNDDFTLNDFSSDSDPRYAILSHTWGPNHEEVSYRDLTEGTGAYKTKLGYRKLQFCAGQAAKDGINLCWIDTCCIDKSSSAELAEAINSMFNWYRNSAKCYVYLPDVSIGGGTQDALSDQTWKTAFQQSRWFTRGWTLQELIAPTVVEFYCAEGQRLGDRESMVHLLHNITGINVEALLQRPLHSFSIEERMSWRRQRKTKREEDAAYSLLGIFDVQMSLIYGEGQKKALARLQREIKIQTVDEPTGPPSLGKSDMSENKTSRPQHIQTPISTIPFSPDADFVDRPEVFEWMHKKCIRPSARIALVGMGGVGKSQLAIQYAHRVRDATLRTHTFWVHASTQPRFKQAYRSLADTLELPRRFEPKADVLRLVSDWLSDENNGQWIMVIDNADDIETLFPSRASEQGEPVNGSASLATYLPQSRNGCILFTSRNRDVAARLAGGYHNIQEVLPMNERQAMDLLRNKLPDGLYEEGPAAELVRTLDYIPLAITQAAAYIGRRTRMTINGYLDEFLENSNARQSLLHRDAGDLRRDGTASNSMVITWQMSFERIHQERSSAAELLSLMSFFNPQGIPEKLLRKYHQWYHRDARRVVEADSDLDAEGLFNEDLDILYAFSLVTPVMGTGISSNATLEMHGLVQFCTRIWLSSKGHEGQWQGAFVELLAQEFPTGQYENWRLCEQLIPHVESVRKTEPMSTELLRAWAHLLTRSGWYLCNRGDYELAEKTTRKALDVQERTFGLSDGNTRESASVLAMILRYQGKTEEAEMLTRRLLDWHEKGTTSDSVSQDPDALSLTAMANQADSLCAQQKYNEAEKLSRHVLDKRCKKLGPNHQDTLMSMYNLAGVFLSQSKHLEASDLAHHVLTMREQDLGPTHPDTLMATSMLATILSRLDQPAKVESLNRHALTGFEKELGPRHPYTLTALANLAWTLRNQAKLAEATEMNRRALDGREKVLGLGHLDTLASVYSLANGLHLLGKLEEAEPLYLRAYDGLVRELGEGHESVAACGRDLEALRGEARVKQGGRKDGVLVREGSILKGVGDRRDSIFARIRGKMRKRG